MENKLARVLREIDTTIDQREALLEIYRRVEIHLNPEEQVLLLSAVECRRGFLSDHYYALLENKNHMLRELKSPDSLQT